MRKRYIALTTAPIISTATSVTAQVSETSTQFGGGYHGHGIMWGNNQWNGFGMILMVLVLVGIAAGAVYLIRQYGVSETDARKNGESAMALLKERFAKGEIDSEEFSERKRLLAD